MSIFSPQELKKLNLFVAKKKFERMRPSFYETKQRMIQEFLNHPVTKEINAGPFAINMSQTLNIRDGNLFSFIGFDAGDSPIDPIINLLNTVSMENKMDVIIYKFPSIGDFWEVTPMPGQSGRSWAKGIESGISGLNYYLFSRNRDFKNSRSGPAIQSNKLKTGARYTPTQYLSTFLKKYRTIFKKLGKANNAYLEII